MLYEIKKAIVFLGTVTAEGHKQPCATGFLVMIQNMFHLVTAKHVITDLGKRESNGNKLTVFFNSKDGAICSRSIGDVRKKYPIEWIFHENKDVDIALTPFELEPEKDDVSTVPDNMFLAPDSLSETCDVFFLSYQPGIQLHKRITPVVRGGTISLINDDKTFYIDAAAFPGNSGSPVFVKPSPIRFAEKGVSIGGDELGGKFIGIIGEYLPYQEIAVSTQTGRPRVVFEENTGLSRVWSVNFIRDIIQSPAFKNQFDRLSEVDGK